MEFISKYNMSFIIFINKKYNKKFKTFENYSLFLFELMNDDIKYYYQLEKDIKQYCIYQQERRSNSGKSKN